MSEKTHLALSPEYIDIANAYLTYGSAKDTAEQLQIAEYEIIKIIERADVKAYINGIYLDRGYRNRNKLGEILDRVIDSKLEEALDSGIYSSKDLLDILAFAHKVRMDEMKAEQSQGGGSGGTTVNIANIPGGGNYGVLMEKLLNAKGPTGGS